MAKRKKKAAPAPLRAARSANIGTFADWFAPSDSVEQHIIDEGINTGDLFIVENADATDPTDFPAGEFEWTGEDLPAGSTADEWTSADFKAVEEPPPPEPPVEPGWPEPEPPRWPSITTAPIPPSVPGIEQPVFDSGSATSPAPPINITGHPIIPPPEIGNPEGVPEFPPEPPDTAPVDVPVGPLVGPAVPAATIPPSVNAPQQPVFQTGSKTAPTAASWFPQFTTTFPKPLTIIFANVWMIGNAKPPYTASTENIEIDEWGLPGPQDDNWQGEGGWQNPPGAGLLEAP